MVSQERLVSLNSLLGAAKQAARGKNIQTEEPTNEELEAFGDGFDRMLVTRLANRNLVDHYTEHQAEILLGLMAAKKQIGLGFDGESPRGGLFGFKELPAYAIGVGDDWDSHGSVTGGIPQNWVHSGTTLMGGSSGNAVKIGPNSVIVITGFASIHPSPKIERFNVTVNGKPRPFYNTGSSWKWNTDLNLRIRDLTDIIFLTKSKTLQIDTMQSTTGVDIPVALGVWYTTEDVMRVADPVNLPGTTNDVILTT